MTTYTDTNFHTKREVKAALASGELIRCIDQTPFGKRPILEGSVTLCGPHYPKSHTWYATGLVEGGYLASLDGMTKAEKDKATLARMTRLAKIKAAAVVAGIMLKPEGKGTDEA